MKKAAILLGVIVAVFYLSSYGMGYLLFHQTKISDEEIFIGRIGATSLSHMEYALNLDTGNEEITVLSLFGQSWFISYGGKCRCITKVHKVGSYYVALIHDEGQVYLSTGKTMRKTVPYEQERHKFVEGMTTRNALKERYADILSPIAKP